MHLQTHGGYRLNYKTRVPESRWWASFGADSVRVDANTRPGTFFCVFFHAWKGVNLLSGACFYLGGNPFACIYGDTCLVIFEYRKTPTIVKILLWRLVDI